MKKFLLRMLASMAVLLPLAGCNKDKGTDSVVGTWEYSQEKIILQMINGKEVEGSAKEIAQKLIEILKQFPGYEEWGAEWEEAFDGLELPDGGLASLGEIRIQFKEDGTVLFWVKENGSDTWTEGGTGEYSYANGKLQIIAEEEEEDGTVTTETITLDVKKLTAKEMVLSIDSAQIGLGEDMSFLTLMGIQGITYELTFVKV